MVLLAVVATVVVLRPSGAGKAGAGTGSGGNRQSAATFKGKPSLHPLLPELRFSGKLSLPWPATGESAVYIPGLGVAGTSKDQKPRPIASETKMMTALVVLHDHPLLFGQNGPEFTMTEKDHMAWIYAAEQDDSNVMVKAGEHLSELQLLEALLVPSADNIADYLARWDAGSLSAFVGKMNAEAKALGLAHTHYADPSGVDPHDLSTAVDQAILAAYAMENPVIRHIVGDVYVTLPVAGRVWNYNPALDVGGIVGVKSGFTPEAQACLVTAAWRSVAGHRLLVVSSTLDQPLGLGQAATVDEGLLQAVTSALEARDLLKAGTVVATASTSWGKEATSVRTRRDLTVLGWPGLVVRPVVVETAPAAGRAGWAAGSEAGLIEVSPGTAAQEQVPFYLDGALGGPPANWHP